MASRAERIAAMFRVDHGAPTASREVVPVPFELSEDTWDAEQTIKKEQRAEKRAKQKKAKAKRAALAARKLAKAGLGVVNVPLLLDELTADEQIKWLSFLVTDGENGRYFNFERMRLRSIGIERRRNSRMKDIRGWIDVEGIHLRWGDHGGLDLRGTSGVITDQRTIRMTFSTGKRVETAA
jgi:hypothetical protein